MKILFVTTQQNKYNKAEFERIAACAGDTCSINSFSTNRWRLRWEHLDINFRTREPGLMDMYDSLYEAACDCDVLLDYGGCDLHPDFVQLLPCFTVYCYFDDPESSMRLSRHVAPAFDAVFYGNIASQMQYESWGCRRIAHLPIFIDPASIPSVEESKSILNAQRDLDIVLCCGKTPWRQRRLAGLIDAFPAANVYGKGWKKGRISNEDMRELYRQSKIGWNIHNSTGPINQRLFTLASWGVMQICDNKTGLGQIYKLEREIVGFDTIPEAIDLTQYYLEHDEERREIAYNAHARFVNDYHPIPLWPRITQQLELWMKEASHQNKRVPTPLCPTRDSHKIAPVRSIQRVASHWLVKQKRSAIKKIKHLRYGSAVAELNESIYLGERKTFQPKRNLLGGSYQRHPLTHSNINNEIHLKTLCWAVSALIGPSKSILATGSNAQQFVELASVDPQRTIKINPKFVDEQNRSHSDYDLFVCTDVCIDRKSFDEILQYSTGCAARFIFCFRDAHTSSGMNFQAACELLVGIFHKVWLSYLPDPYVPWLEPVERSIRNTTIIAECTARGNSHNDQFRAE